MDENKPSGYDLLKDVRAKDAQIPFIFASGYSKESEWPKAKESGATAYLQLPFEPEEIIEIFK